jgi:hypothetical protein
VRWAERSLVFASGYDDDKDMERMGLGGWSK